ncbi:hypothetical protein ACJJIE_04655 [Microbulbifer sp. TRSA001]|uniref:hypothetical protein n=1 Tax=Microbulbifer sp. TRSA001 TaxID=3243381 RepID=UPI0040391E90
MVYLNDLLNRLLNGASERDISLYRFLHGRKHSIRVAPNDIEAELCFKAFVEGEGEGEGGDGGDGGDGGGGGDGGAILLKLKKIKPFKGLHYSNNLVLLTAAALIDIAGEESNIKRFLSVRGYKEQLIINSALGSNYIESCNTFTPVDHLAYLIQENEFISEKEIQQCLTSVCDLYDLFVLERAIAKSILQSNEESNFQSYVDLVSAQNIALNRVEFASFLFLFLALCYLMYLTFPPIVSLVVESWDTLEPYAYLLDKTALGIVLITGVVIATKVDSIKSRFRKFVLKGIYKLLGVDYPSYVNLKKTLRIE